jgi:hypothetical protein
MNDALYSLRRVLPAAALVALLLLLIVHPPTGWAQEATATATATTPTTAEATQPPDPGNLSITAVQPGTVVTPARRRSSSPASASSMARLSSCQLGRAGDDVVSRQVLRANVTAGVPPGSYDVQVVSPNAATAVLAAGCRRPARRADRHTGADAHRRADRLHPPAARRPVLWGQRAADHAQSEPRLRDDPRQRRQATAGNVLVTFVSGDFVPRATGGVRALGTMAPGQPVRFWQPLFATADLRGKTAANAQGDHNLYRYQRPELRVIV